LSFAAEYLFGTTDFGAHDSMNDVLETNAVWRFLDDAQRDVLNRGYAYDEDGNIMLDKEGNYVYLDENDNPMIDPHNHAFLYLDNLNREQIHILDN
jgi:hypothetical protein